MSRSIALLLVLIFLTALCVVAVKLVSAPAADTWVSKTPVQVARGVVGSPTLAQESISTPETTQPISIPPIWLLAIVALVVIVIIELIIYFFLKGGKRSES
jgi:hypothetical protein